MKLRLIPFAAIAFVMASCSSEDVMEINTDPSGDALTFSIGVGHSRATETKPDNLGNFNVVAKGIHPHGGLYDNFLIGGDDGQGEIARRQGSSNIWELDRKVYWPTSMSSAVFWAYTFAQSTGNTAILPTGVSFAFETDGKTPKISGFSPVKADLSGSGTDGYWDDGANQTDMLVAFTQQDRATSASSVSLTFDHALSQIEIKAKSAGKLDKDNRIVRVKGAWIVNTKKSGELSAGFVLDDNKKATISPNWTLNENGTEFSAYGSFYSTPILLNKDNKDNAASLLGSSLMIIPQELTAWSYTGPSVDTGTMVSDNGGVYILLLCRVELEHSGIQHEGNPNDTDIDDVKVYNGKHYHQQFPVNKDNKFDEGEYGFVCVPVGAKTEADKEKFTLSMGKKYIFTLDICGSTTGAGIYPPDFSDEIVNALVPQNHTFASGFGATNVPLTVTRRAANVKAVGEPVLDSEITFSVDVNGWADSDWKDASDPIAANN